MLLMYWYFPRLHTLWGLYVALNTFDALMFLGETHGYHLVKQQSYKQISLASITLDTTSTTNPVLQDNSANTY